MIGDCIIWLFTVRPRRRMERARREADRMKELVAIRRQRPFTAAEAAEAHRLRADVLAQRDEILAAAGEVLVREAEQYLRSQ